MKKYHLITTFAFMTVASFFVATKIYDRSGKTLLGGRFPASAKSSDIGCNDVVDILQGNVSSLASLKKTSSAKDFHSGLDQLSSKNKISGEEMAGLIEGSPYLNELNVAQPLLKNSGRYLGLTGRDLQEEFKRNLAKTLVDFASTTKTQKEFIDILDKMRFAQLHAEDQQKVLLSSPFFKKLLDKHKEMEGSIKFNGNAEFDNSIILRNIENLMKVLLEEDPAEAASYVNSSYAFVKFIQRLREDNLSRNEVILGALASSSYARKMGLSIGKISQITNKIADLSDDDPELLLASVIKVIKDELPVFKTGTKNINSINPFDGEISIVEVKNQCNWGSCWVFSATAKMEIEVSRKFGKKTPLSPEYFYAEYIIEKMQEVIQFETSLPKKDLFEEGGWFFLHKVFSNKYGAVPKSVWTGRLDFGEAAQKKQLLEELRTFLGKYFVEMKKAKPVALAALKLDYQKQIRGIVEKYSGVLPDQFVFSNEKISPQDFLRKYYPDTERTEPMYIVPQELSGPIQPDVFVDRFEVIQGGWIKKEMKLNIQGLTFEDLEKVLIENIDNQIPVILDFRFPKYPSYKVNGQVIPFVDNVTGRMTVPPGPEPEPVPYDGGHAVLAIGYELNAAGRIKTIKILNSWGERAGDSGIYYMDQGFFYKMLSDIQINKKLPQKK